MNILSTLNVQKRNSSFYFCIHSMAIFHQNQNHFPIFVTYSVLDMQRIRYLVNVNITIRFLSLLLYNHRYRHPSWIEWNMQMICPFNNTIHNSIISIYISYSSYINHSDFEPWTMNQEYEIIANNKIIKYNCTEPIFFNV